MRLAEIWRDPVKSMTSYASLTLNTVLSQDGYGAGLLLNLSSTSLPIPRLTTTVGYDPRFSNGNFGVWCECAPEQLAEAEAIMRRHGAVEVRGER